jgi:hypothetical protein
MASIVVQCRSVINLTLSTFVLGVLCTRSKALRSQRNRRATHFPPYSVGVLGLFQLKRNILNQDEYSRSNLNYIPHWLFELSGFESFDTQ